MLNALPFKKRSTWKTSVVTGCCLLLAAGACARAQSFVSGPGLAMPISDDAYLGTLASMDVGVITVPPGTGTVGEVTVAVSLYHTHIGDLVFKLQSPEGTVVTLMHRPLLAGVPDDGSGCCGDNARFDILYPVYFNDSAPSSIAAEQMGLDISDIAVFDIVGDPRNASPDNYIPSAGDLGGLPGASLLDSLSAFSGEQAEGIWQLYIGDCRAGSTGFLDAWWLIFGPDADGDEVENWSDNCLHDSNPDQADGDGDGVGDVCDNCPQTANANQRDADQDGLGDACDPETIEPDPPPYEPDGCCSCGTTGPVSGFGLVLGMLLLGRFAGYRTTRRRQ